MRSVLDKVLDFLEREDGPTTVEYAFLLTFIVVVCIGTIRVIGLATAPHFANVAAELPK